MGQIGVTLTTMAGTAIGAQFGMPQLGAMVGSMVGNEIFGKAVKGPRMSDLSVSVSTYGVAIPQLYGTMRISGNMIWSGGIKETSKKSRAGKGGQKQKTYTYSASFAMALCKGPAVQVLRIWADTKQVYGPTTTRTKLQAAADATNGGIVGNLADYLEEKESSATVKNAIKFRFYPGTEEQLPDSLIVADKGADDTPAFRGLCYIVIENMALEDYGNRIPQITVELSKTVPSLGHAYRYSVPFKKKSNKQDNTADFLIDWEGSTLYRRNVDKTNELVRYSLDTLREEARRPFDFEGKMTLTPNGGPVWTQARTELNCGPLIAYNNRTLRETIAIGTTGIFFDNLGQSECTPYNYRTVRLARLGTMLGFTGYPGDTGRIDYVVTAGGFGAFFIFTSTGDWVYSGGSEARDPYMGRLRQDDKVAQFCMWQNFDSTGFFLEMVTVPARHLSSTASTPSGPNGCMQAQFIADPRIKQEVITVDDPVLHAASLRVHKRHGNLAPRATPGKLTAFNVMYDPTDDSVVVLGMIQQTVQDRDTPCVAKYSITEKRWKYCNTFDNVTTPIGFPPFNSMGQSRLRGEQVVWLGKPNNNSPAYSYVVSLSDGAMTASVIRDIDAGTDNEIASIAVGCWDDVDKVYVLSQRGLRFYKIQPSPGGTTVAAIITEMCRATGNLNVEDIDVSEINDEPVRGYTISREATARDCLTQLSGAYFFDGVESDHKLKFVSRGRDSIVTIPENMLGFVEGEDVTIRETVTQEPELPMRVSLNYSSIERDYQTGSQFAKRRTGPVSTMYSKTEVSTELPLALTATDAKRIVDKSLKSTWVGRTTVSLKLPWHYLLYDPTDVVTVMSDKGVSYNLRLLNANLGVDYSIQASGITEAASSYVSVVTGTTPGVASYARPSGTPPEMVVLNTPLIRDVDDTQGVGSRFYLGYYNPRPFGPTSAVFFESATGLEYTDIASTTRPMESGLTNNALPAVTDWNATDEDNILSIWMDHMDDTLETVTQEQMLAGANAAMVGGEIIGFREAVQDDDGNWLLKGLLRGRRGTQNAMRGHTENERFLILSPDTMTSALHGPDAYTATRLLKAASPGQSEDDMTAVSIAFQPNDLKPMPPEAFRFASHDPAAKTARFRFARSSRISNGIADSVSEAPYREGSNGFFRYTIYPGKTPEEVADMIAAGDTTPDTGTINIFAADNSYADLAIDVPYDFTTNPGGMYTLRVREVGFVEGWSKLVAFTAEPAIDGSRTPAAWAYREYQ